MTKQVAPNVHGTGQCSTPVCQIRKPAVYRLPSRVRLRQGRKLWVRVITR